MRVALVANGLRAVPSSLLIIIRRPAQVNLCPRSHDPERLCFVRFLTDGRGVSPKSVEPAGMEWEKGLAYVVRRATFAA